MVSLPHSAPWHWAYRPVPPGPCRPSFSREPLFHSVSELETSQSRVNLIHSEFFFLPLCPEEETEEHLDMEGLHLALAVICPCWHPLPRPCSQEPSVVSVYPCWHPQRQLSSHLASDVGTTLASALELHLPSGKHLLTGWTSSRYFCDSLRQEWI